MALMALRGMSSRSASRDTERGCARRAGAGACLSSVCAHRGPIHAVAALPRAQGAALLSAGKDALLRLIRAPALDAADAPAGGHNGVIAAGVRTLVIWEVTAVKLFSLSDQSERSPSLAPLHCSRPSQPMCWAIGWLVWLDESCCLYLVSCCLE